MDDFVCAQNRYANIPSNILVLVACLYSQTTMRITFQRDIRCIFYVAFFIRTFDEPPHAVTVRHFWTYIDICKNE